MLGKIEKVDLRKAWKNEASDFTNWLAQEENLAILSDELGIDISLIQTEAPSGKFNVDILAEEENTGRRIIIENQLESTNHDHLGKLITYASGHDAEIIIWIVKEVREEHRQAVDWLNEHTDDKVNFFAIKLELWQIGNSPYAPKFQILSKPNDWAKAIKRSSGGSSSLTDTKVMQLNFWDKFKEYAQNKGTTLRLRKTNPAHWYDISIGSSEAYVALTVNTKTNLIECGLYISNSKQLYHELAKYRDEIEKELKNKLEWMELQGNKASRIRLRREADLDATEKWDDYFEWLKTEAEAFQTVFLKYIKQIKK